MFTVRVHMDQILKILFLSLVVKTSWSYPHTSRVTCSPCPPGSRVIHPCTSDSDASCGPCEADTFSGSPSNLTVCQPCTKCSRHEFTEKPCSATTDIVCSSCLNSPKTKSKKYIASCESDVGENSGTKLHDTMMGDAPAVEDDVNNGDDVAPDGHVGTDNTGDDNPNLDNTKDVENNGGINEKDDDVNNKDTNNDNSVHGEDNKENADDNKDNADSNLGDDAPVVNKDGNNEGASNAAKDESTNDNAEKEDTEEKDSVSDGAEKPDTDHQGGEGDTTDDNKAEENTEKDDENVEHSAGDDVEGNKEAEKTEADQASEPHKGDESEPNKGEESEPHKGEESEPHRGDGAAVDTEDNTAPHTADDTVPHIADDTVPHTADDTVAHTADDTVAHTADDKAPDTAENTAAEAEDDTAPHTEDNKEADAEEETAPGTVDNTEEHHTPNEAEKDTDNEDSENKQTDSADKLGGDEINHDEKPDDENNDDSVDKEETDDLHKQKVLAEEHKEGEEHDTADSHTEHHASSEASLSDNANHNDETDNTDGAHTEEPSVNPSDVHLESGTDHEHTETDADAKGNESETTGIDSGHGLVLPDTDSGEKNADPPEESGLNVNIPHAEDGDNAHDVALTTPGTDGAAETEDSTKDVDKDAGGDDEEPVSGRILSGPASNISHHVDHDGKQDEDTTETHDTVDGHTPDNSDGEKGDADPVDEEVSTPAPDMTHDSENAVTEGHLPAELDELHREGAGSHASTLPPPEDDLTPDEDPTTVAPQDATTDSTDLEESKHGIVVELDPENGETTNETDHEIVDKIEDATTEKPGDETHDDEVHGTKDETIDETADHEVETTEGVPDESSSTTEPDGEHEDDGKGLRMFPGTTKRIPTLDELENKTVQHSHEADNEEILNNPQENIGKSHDEDDEEDDSGSRTAIIVGVVIGGVALFALAFFASRYYKKRRGHFKEMKKVTNGKDGEEVEFRPLNHNDNVYEDPDTRPTNGIYRPGAKTMNACRCNHQKDEMMDIPDIYAVPDKSKKAPLLGRVPAAEELSQSPSAQEPLISGVEKLKYIDDSTDDEYVNTVRERLLPPRSPASRLTNVIEETPPTTPSINQPSRPNWSPNQSKSGASNGHKNGSTPKQVHSSNQIDEKYDDRRVGANQGKIIPSDEVINC